jgi:hypothetical protein
MAARWGYFEDSVRLAAALRPALAARGVPEAIYVDYADPPVMPTGSLERFHRRDFRPRLSA